MGNTPTPNLISLSTGTLVRAVLVVVLFYLLYVLRDVVLVLLTSVVIASSVEPMAQWFIRRKINRLIAVVLIYAVALLILAGLFYAFVPPLLDEVGDFTGTLPTYIDTITVWNPTNDITSGLVPAVQGLSQTFSLGDMVAEIKQAIAGVSNGFIQTASAVFGGVASFVLIVVLSFYLSVLDDGIGAFLRIVTPLKHENYVVDLWERSQDKIGQWMQGQLILAVIIGVLTYLGLLLIGVPYAFLLAILAGITELIPIFGPIIAAIPAVSIGFIDGGVTLALVVIGFYLIIQQFENHLIYPLVVRKVVGVPPLLVIIALLIGFKLAGFIGVILSVPIAAVLREFIDDLERDKRVAHGTLQEEKKESKV